MELADGREFKAVEIKTDPASDLAVVRLGDADVLGRDIAPPQRLDRIAESGEHGGRLGARAVSEDYRLAPAHRQAGHGVLVAHSARQAQRIAHGAGGIGIVPEPRAARCRTKMGGMDRDDRGQAARPVMHQLHAFMRVVIGLGPEGGHQLFPVCSAGNISKGGGDGAIEGARTPDLRYHKPAL